MNSRVATVFIDALLIMLLVFVLLPHKPSVAEADDTRAGDLVVEISWPDCQASDVDLWVQSPGDKPVGYSRLRGKHFSLLRDDLGATVSCNRSELAASRELVDGEWVVNVHLYTDRAQAVPFPVNVSIWYRRGAQPGLGRTSIWSGNVTLQSYGQEVTAVRWKMFNGGLVPGSIHHTQTALRSGSFP